MLDAIRIVERYRGLSTLSRFVERFVGLLNVIDAFQVYEDF